MSQATLVGTKWRFSGSYSDLPSERFEHELLGTVTAKATAGYGGATYTFNMSYVTFTYGDGIYFYENNTQQKHVRHSVGEYNYKQYRATSSGTSYDLEYYEIEVTGGALATNESYINWFETNGTDITPKNVVLQSGSQDLYPQTKWGNLVGSISSQADLAAALNDKQHTLTAGSNITIVDNTISATGGVDYSIFYKINTTLTNVTAGANNPKLITADGQEILTFSASSSYALPSSVTVTGATSSWNSSTGELTLSNATDNVSISITGVRLYTISVTTNNITAAASNPTAIAEGSTAVLTFNTDGVAFDTPDNAPVVTGATSVYTKISNSECTVSLSNPTGNVSFTIEGSLAIVMPEKGDLIYVNLTGESNAITPGRGYNNVFRVLKTSGKNAELMGMFDIVRGQYKSSSPYNTYSGSLLDTYLNTTWYNTLSETAKAAIVDKDLTQYQYSYNSSAKTTNHQSYAQYSTKSSKQSVGLRHVYALGIEDVEEYFSNTFTSTNLLQFFFKENSYYSSDYIWLSSAQTSNTSYAYMFYPSYGYIDKAYGSYSEYYRPVLTLDLSKISFQEAGPFNITNTLTNCTKTSGVTSLMAGQTGEIIYSENSGYQLPESITVSGASYTWSKANKKVTLSNPTGPITVTIVGETRTDPYDLSVSASNITADPTNPTQVPVAGHGSVDLKFTVGSDYILPFGDDITVNYATKSWNRSTGTLTLSKATQKTYVYISGVARSEETWLVNSTLTNLYTKTYETDFTSNGTHYDTITANSSENKLYYGDLLVYNNGTWIDETYRTIVFGYATDTAGSTFRNQFLYYNAVLQGPFPVTFRTPYISSGTASSYNVYDGTDETGTLMGTVSGDSMAPSVTFRFNSGHVYCKPTNESAEYDSSSSYSGMSNVTYTYSTPAYIKGDIDTSSEYHNMDILFRMPTYSIDIYNTADMSTGGTIEVYDGTSSTGPTVARIYPGSSSYISISSGNMYISCSDSYMYPYNSCTTTGGVTETSHNTESATFSVSGSGSVNIKFAKPTYAVNITSNGGMVDFYDGMGSYGTMLCSLSGGMSQTVNVSSGNIYGTWSPMYRWTSGSSTGGVSYPMYDSYSFNSSVTGDGTLTVQVDQNPY